MGVLLKGWEFGGTILAWLRWLWWRVVFCEMEEQASEEESGLYCVVDGGVC
jgi:hypothetical protein